MSFTKQETFDIVARHLLTQAKMSLDGEGCAYRGEGGLKCAVGALIPDDMYLPIMEGAAADSEVIVNVIERIGHDSNLCVKLQSIHDRSDIHDWPMALRGLSAKHQISSAVVDELEPSFREKLAAN